MKRRAAARAARRVAALGAAPRRRERVDLLIRGGTIYTGADAPFVGDVAITRRPHRRGRPAR